MLQKVDPPNSGEYTCTDSNIEGDTTSPCQMYVISCSHKPGFILCGFSDKICSGTRFLDDSFCGKSAGYMTSQHSQHTSSKAKACFCLQLYQQLEL